MSWRELLKCEVPRTHDTSDKSPTSVTSVTAFWNPQTANIAPEPTEPTRAGQGESDTPRECNLPLPEPTQSQIDAAGRTLAACGPRLIGGVRGVDYIGIWSDLDSAGVRVAIAVFHPGGVPVRYLDGDDIPMKYKLRRVPGEPVPANVLAAMEQHPVEPWKVRDQMLEEMGWTPEGVPWATWQAQRLNQLFCELGKAGQPARIKPETVRHGLKGNLK